MNKYPYTRIPGARAEGRIKRRDCGYDVTAIRSLIILYMHANQSQNNP